MAFKQQGARPLNVPARENGRCVRELDQPYWLFTSKFNVDENRKQSNETPLTANGNQNLAFGKPVQSSAPSASPFSVARITDGGTGNLEFYLGYPAAPKPISITIDLQKAQQINRIVVVAYTIHGSYEKYSVEVSQDGKSFTEVGSRLEKPEKPTPRVEHKFEPQNARYIRVRSHGNRGHVFDSFSKIIEIQAF